MAGSQSNISQPEREFGCPYCQRAFRRLEHLQRHTRRHTNEKPFSCYCGASFSRRDLLRRHERVSRHLERFNDPLAPTTDGTRRFIPGQDELTFITNDNSIIHANNTQYDADTSAYHSPRSLRSSAHIESFPASSVFLDSVLRSPETEQGKPSLDNCPTIFPSPQLSLASQIIPHFACPNVTSSDRSRLLFSLRRAERENSQANLPSTSALTRFLSGYFTGFYSHCPFTHSPTFKLEECSPELCFAMMAVGAQDRFESASAMQLFHFSKVLLFESQKSTETSKNIRLGTTSRRELIDQVSCLLCLAQFATWQSDSSLKTEACILQSLLAQKLRSSGLEEYPETMEYHNWEKWAQEESARRTKFFAFCFLGIQNIANDTPPSIFSDEINLKLPCSCPEWTAPDAVTWNLLRQNTPNEQGYFRDTLEALLSPDYQSSNTNSPVANYVLVHGLLQNIVWARRSRPGVMSQLSSRSDEDIFETALRRWTSCWQQTPESNLEPLDPNGPLPFKSSALLSMAYVRNCAVVSKPRNIFSWEPSEIAHSLKSSLSADRTWGSLLAANHSTNFLATLVKLGIQYFKHNQAILWSIEATLCGLESCIFLEKWLSCLQSLGEDTPLTDHEIQLINWIKEIVHEGLSSVNDCSFEDGAQPSLVPGQIISIWSHIMLGNSPFPFIKMVGEALLEYRKFS